jgi:dynein heavy chain
MAENVALAFGKTGDAAAKFEDALREPGNLRKVNDFLDGKTNQTHLLFFYQKPDVVNDAGELIDSPGEAKLLITNGEQERIKKRACFFVRTCAEGKAINEKMPSDNELIFGEVAANPLESMGTCLGDVFVAMMQKNFQEKEVWVKCEVDQRREFMTGLEKFTVELNDGIRSLVGGVQLRKWAPQYEVDPRTQSPQEIVQNTEIVAHFEMLLEDWCRQIEDYLEQPIQAGTGKTDPGPRTELEYWQARMQRIISIMEQLRGRSARLFLGCYMQRRECQR